MASQSSVTSSGPFTTTVSNLPLRFVRPSASVFKGSPAHVSTLSSPAAEAGIRPVPHDDHLEQQPPVASPVAFRPPASASWTSCPAEGFRPSYDRPTRTSKSPGPDGVSTFHAHETRPGRAPPIPQASGVLATGSHSPVAACRPSQRPGPITQVFVPSSKVRNNEASSGVHSRSPARPSPRPVAPPDGTGALRLLPWARTPTDKTRRRTPDPSTQARAGIDLEH